MKTYNSINPSSSMVQQIISDNLGCGCSSVERFPTGLCHFVFGVHTTDDQDLVVRISQQRTRRYLEGALYWYDQLRQIGVPLPKLIAHNTEAHNPFMIISLLPGQDLGECYGQLSAKQKEQLAVEIVGIQKLVHGLPEARGFGYAVTYDDPVLTENVTWLDVLHKGIARARSWIRQGKVCEESHVDRVARFVDSHGEYFERVRPTAFLDDTTTKNVLVHKGKLAGIVDVDEVCFGDPIHTLALTRMALLAGGHDLDYVEYWKACLSLDRDQETALDIYTAICCVTFMGELGMQFNKDVPSPVEPQQIKQYEDILDQLLK